MNIHFTANTLTGHPLAVSIRPLLHKRALRQELDKTLDKCFDKTLDKSGFQRQDTEE